MKYTKRFAGVILFLIAIVVYVMIKKNGLTLAWVQSNRLYFEQLVDGSYYFAVFSFIIFFVIAAALNIPVTILLTVSAGYFFGALPGALYAITGATVGSILSFLIYRYFLGEYVQKRYSKKLRAFNNAIEQYGAHYLLVLQLLPVTPTMLINIFAGLTKISFFTFFWTTAIGIAPGTLIYAVAGRQLAHLSSLNDLFSLLNVLLLLVLACLAFVPVIVRSLGIKMA
ncbi:TVP38/TMEM64 family protein [bacterium]|nr:TVP38/TMEM64 family protein [bacterium]